jgi:hypothetical protein
MYKLLKFNTDKLTTQPQTTLRAILYNLHKPNDDHN